MQKKISKLSLLMIAFIAIGAAEGLTAELLTLVLPIGDPATDSAMGLDSQIG